MPKMIGNADCWHFWVVRTIITIVIITICQPEVLLFKVQCLICFGEAITPFNDRIFKPVYKYAYPRIWRVDSLKIILETLSSILSWLRFRR